MQSPFAVAASLSVVLSLCAAASAQLGVASRPASKAELDAFRLNRGTVQQLAPLAAPFGFQAEVDLRGSRAVLQLSSHDVRSHDFQLLVDDGTSIRRVPTPANTTYRGKVAGHPDSVVAASLVGGRIWATISLDGKTWGVEPLNERVAGAPAGDHVVYDNADVRKDPSIRCGTNDPTEPPVRSGGPQSPNMVLWQTEIAIDCDLEFFQRNGSNVTNTQNAATRIVNGVDAIYRRDTEIIYKITTILVRTSRTYGNTDMRRLLPEFQNYWIRNHGGIKRDVAQLFTGKGSFSGIVGIAYLSVICSQSSGFAVNKAFAGHTTNVGLVAHELGHNWSAPHCNSSNPCNIMCSGLGGCSGNLTSFAPVSRNQIIAFRGTRGCLDRINQGPPGSFTSFGTACRGTGGVPNHSAFGSPKVGGGGFYNVLGAAPNTQVWLVIGLSNTTFNGIPLPFDLGVIGAPGCNVYNDHALIFSGRTSFIGGWTVIYQFPTDPAFTGLSLYSQFLNKDAGANTFGLTTTNGIHTKLGGPNS